MSGRGRFFRPRLAFSAGRGTDTAPAAAGPGTERSFRETMLPHMDAAYNFARYLACDTVAAEDIVQAAFLRALRGFGSFRGEAPKAWLFAIVRNCFLDSVRAGRDTAALDNEADEGAVEESGGVDHDTPEAILSRKRDAQRLRETIESLPEPFREAIVLRELEELSYREIAMIAGVPIGTVMSRLARGRQMLCELLVPSDEQGRRAAQ
jgi:RNA polymerase sigma factor (sigma-70 family)